MTDGKAIPGEDGSLRFAAETAGRHRVTCRAENANGTAEYTWDVEVPMDKAGGLDIWPMNDPPT